MNAVTTNKRVGDACLAMRYRRLGNSELHVSELALGSWLTYGVTVDRETTGACVRCAFDQGINFVDTANMYGRGAAESLLGELLSPYKRDAYVLATKVYFPMSDTDRGLSRADTKADRCVAQAAADRLRRPLPVPSLRPRHSA